MGGEKLKHPKYTTDKGGLPPRRRGKETPLHYIPSFAGITPAQAGKRWMHSVPRLGFGDHPRTCGEKLSQLAMGLVAQGSPPRRRGKVNDLRDEIARNGITPA